MTKATAPTAKPTPKAKTKPKPTTKPKAKDKNGLTPRRKRFVEEYVRLGNGTQAAANAGFSPKTAKSQATQLLKEDVVMSAITTAREELAERNRLDADFVVTRLMREADAEGAGSTHAGRVQALGMLGKILGLFVDRHEIADSRPVGLNQAVDVQITITGKPEDQKYAVPALEA